MTVVEASHPRVCEVCGGDGVVRLLLPGTPIDLCADCPHCVGRIPIVKESKTKWQTTSRPSTKPYPP